MQSNSTQGMIIEGPKVSIVSITEDKIALIAKALNSKTRLTILQKLDGRELDISQIAAELGQTEANVSAQIKILEKSGLVTSDYQRGHHGIRKVCSKAIDTIQIDL